MKKQLVSWLLAVCMAVSLLVLPAGAASVTTFADVRGDDDTALAVETLRLMGVLDGYSDRTFRPSGTLNRAQFCKMVINAIGASDELGRYATVTVFPDVKPSHWASSYINLAAKGKSIIAGYADGNFHPERSVTLGHAVTILLRLLGYKDADIGGVWPDRFVAIARSIGLTDGVGTDGRVALTRAQTARLFLNLLRADKADGSPFYTLSEETTFTSLDGGRGRLVTSDKTYDMKKPRASSGLVGSRGQVVIGEDGKALTFLPLAAAGGEGSSSSAVIVYSDGSTSGLSALAGGSSYTIYKNGLRATASDLKRDDVATYSASTNAILVCDTRITVYYESCYPSPEAPSSIEVLGGTTLNVLPSATDSLSAFRPGKTMTLLLTADGQVAGARESGSSANAVGIVGDDGTIRLLCGATELTLAQKAGSEYYGQAVRVSSSKRDAITLSKLGNARSGELNVEERTLGGRALAENVIVYSGGERTSLSQLDRTTVPASEITSSRTNWRGDVDLIVLGGDWTSTEFYGRATVTKGDEGETLTIQVENGSRSVGPFASGYDVKDGAYVAARLTKSADRFASLRTLERVQNVSFGAWVGKTAVTAGGRTYTVSEDVPCYNRDSQRWITLEQAKVYGGTLDLYVSDGVVRVVEVHS